MLAMAPGRGPGRRRFDSCPALGWQLQSGGESMDSFEELVGRVKAITGLNGREASVVAMDLTSGESDAVFSAADIARRAEELGYEFEKPETLDERKSAPAAEVTMDPAEV